MYTNYDTNLNQGTICLETIGLAAQVLGKLGPVQLGPGRRLKKGVHPCKKSHEAMDIFRTEGGGLNSIP